MSIKNATISKGFIIAGCMNASVLIFSRFFTNATITEFDPEVMSNFGLLMILIWGLAYMAVAKNYHHVKWLVGVFALEKFIYGCVWSLWLFNHRISDVFEQDTMAGLFYAMYGLNDWLFFIFFLLVFVRLSKSKDKS